MATLGAWRTHHELAFLAGLGRYRRDVTDRPTRLQLLFGYQAGLLLRTEWGGIDPTVLLSAVGVAIAREYQKETRTNG